MDQISNLVFDKNIVKQFGSTISIGYSALHGTGFVPVSKLLEKHKITNVKYVSKMIEPDSFFSLFDSKQILDLSKKYNMRFTAYFGKKKLKDVEKTKLT